jgi:hypothetical protein
MDASLKQLRIVHLALLASLATYAWVGEWIKKEPKTFDQTFFKTMVVLAFVSATIVLFIRLRPLSAAAEQLQLESGDVAALRRWHVLHILSFALCESIGLYGIVVRLVAGASFSQAAGFYAGAILLLLLSTPRRP